MQQLQVFGDGRLSADKNGGASNTPDTKFCIASLGKMFTAVAVAQLVQNGKLSFEDTVGKYVPGFPAKISDKITVDQLLTHTSGLGDAALRPERTAGPATTTGALLRKITKEPLQFEPGSRFGYSNDGFIVLGAIIERITGEHYRGYAVVILATQDQVLVPAVRRSEEMLTR
jgi:CubicO group peptidase (beta-lactamase class C family)